MARTSRRSCSRATGRAGASGGRVALCARMVFPTSAVILSGLIGTLAPEVNTWLVCLTLQS